MLTYCVLCFSVLPDFRYVLPAWDHPLHLGGKRESNFDEAEEQKENIRKVQLRVS